MMIIGILPPTLGVDAIGSQPMKLSRLFGVAIASGRSGTIMKTMKNSRHAVADTRRKKKKKKKKKKKILNLGGDATAGMTALSVTGSVSITETRKNSMCPVGDSTTTTKLLLGGDATDSRLMTLSGLSNAVIVRKKSICLVGEAHAPAATRQLTQN
jgi:hypothetical protein